MTIGRGGDFDQGGLAYEGICMARLYPSGHACDDGSFHDALWFDVLLKMSLGGKRIEATSASCQYTASCHFEHR